MTLLLISFLAASARADDNLWLDKAAAPTAEKAAELAGKFVAEGETAGVPRLHKDDEGLALDNSDPRDPKVVALVGPCWFVPVKGGKNAAGGIVIDQGTGAMICRADEVAPMPSSPVFYIQDYQLVGKALRPGDNVGSISYGYGGLSLLLEVANGKAVQMTISPVSYNIPRQGKTAKVKFGNGTGTIASMQYGQNGVRLQAVNEDKTLMAQGMVMEKALAAPFVERFKDILAALKPRPEGTYIWPADARPWISSMEGWSAPTNYGAGGDEAIWHPTTQARTVNRGIAGVYRPVNNEVYVAGKILHPYELPSLSLGGYLQDAKLVSTRYVRFHEWVGVERTYDLSAPNGGLALRRYYNPNQKIQTAPYRARVLDLHKDVRRLMIRCQAPRGEFEKHTKEFDKILDEMKIPGPGVEPVVVPANPSEYKPPKAD